MKYLVSVSLLFLFSSSGAFASGWVDRHKCDRKDKIHDQCLFRENDKIDDSLDKQIGLCKFRCFKNYWKSGKTKYDRDNKQERCEEKCEEKEYETGYCKVEGKDYMLCLKKNYPMCTPKTENDDSAMCWRK